MHLQKSSNFEITKVKATETLQLSIISCHNMPYCDLFIRHIVYSYILNIYIVLVYSNYIFMNIYTIYVVYFTISYYTVFFCLHS